MKKIILLLFIIASSLTSQAQSSCRAEFSYAPSGNRCGSGYFKVYDVLGAAKKIGYVSSGFMGTANDGKFVSIKNIGAIPQGTYSLSIKSSSKNIFRLNPISIKGSYGRNGFLIHGYKKGQSKEEASRGCIILDYNQRKALRKAFDECNGEMILKVKTK